MNEILGNRNNDLKLYEQSEECQSWYYDNIFPLILDIIKDQISRKKSSMFVN